MSITSIQLKRTEIMLRPDASRVLLRPFVHGDPERTAAIVKRVLDLDETSATELLTQVMGEFSSRHLNIGQAFLDRFQAVCPDVPAVELSETRQMLVGAYFVAEYAVESAALFNPSIVPDPDQSGLADGALRFVLSLRGTGEGHISSITFRTGVIQADHSIHLATPTGVLTEPRQIPNPAYEKALFARRLGEMDLNSGFTECVLDGLGDSFALGDLRAAIDRQLRSEDLTSGVLLDDKAAAAAIWTLARSNFEVQFEPHQPLSERILFPATPSQRNGIEDARFVRFQNDDGSHTYYGTFTAYDGNAVMPELVETDDFLRFRFVSLNGPAARNKGMALFPRKINGRYAMLSRQDAENIYIMFSDNVHFWNERQILLTPSLAWELVQIGNCGSPIETEAGWLVLSHGVGPVRKYCIGAFLLDRENPGKVIARLRHPMLQPEANEREGYVPNVVYTCGALIHGDELIIPYGLSDHATSFATVPLAGLLAAMEPIESFS